MKKLKRNTGSFILRAMSLIPPKSATAAFILGLMALLTTSTTSCEPQVMCYDPLPPDTIPQDTLDSTRLIQPTDTMTGINE